MKPPAATPERTWSLRQRSAWHFSVFSTLYLLLAGGLFTFAYSRVIARELDEELLEQVDSLQAAWAASGLPPEKLASHLLPSTQADRETPLAFAFPQDASARPPALPVLQGQALRIGEQRMLRHALVTEEVGVERPTRSLRRVCISWPGLGPGVVVMDGQEWIERTSAFAWAMAALVAVGSLGSLLVGRWHGRSIGRWLESIEEHTRSAATSSGPAAPPSGAGPLLATGSDSPLPSEISRVVQAIDTKLARTHAATERARLLGAGLAHDLRAPVQTLMTGLQVARWTAADDPQAAPGRAEELDGWLAETRALARRIDNLVHYGGPELSEGAYEGSPFDLPAELMRALEAEEREAARRGIFLDVHHPPRLGVLADAPSLLLAIRNLVSNAISWSPSGGRVELGLRVRAPWLRIRVEDEGPGVPLAQRETIFEAFVSGTPAPGRRAGYGLGLAVVQRVARAHRGRVRVRATGERSSGARFDRLLPIAREV